MGENHGTIPNVLETLTFEGIVSHNLEMDKQKVQRHSDFLFVHYYKDLQEFHLIVAN